VRRKGEECSVDVKKKGLRQDCVTCVFLGTRGWIYCNIMPRSLFRNCFNQFCITVVNLRTTIENTSLHVVCFSV